MYLQAPKVWDEEITRKADIFLFWKALLALQAGAVGPFKGTKSEISLFHRQMLIWDSWKSNILAYALPLLNELVTDCWQQTPEECPSAEELFKKILENDFSIFEGVNPTEVRSYLSWCFRNEKQNVTRTVTPRQILKTLRRAGATVPGIDLLSFDESEFIDWTIRCDRGPTAF
jgi:hypothetical protein